MKYENSEKSKNTQFNPSTNPPPNPPLPNPPLPNEGDGAFSRWFLRKTPPFIYPFIRLARIDQPTGMWLLLWPCLWGISLASATLHHYPSFKLIMLFALGALVMRGAGCTYNDIVDRDIDAQVARTQTRPLPAGQVSLSGALIFMFAQCGLGLGVLLQLNNLAVILGISSIACVAIYPFMKRITWWPQLFLGLTFNWGIWIGYAAVLGRIDFATAMLYLAGVFWTLGYDTIYAHQDRKDDERIGIKSSARRLGKYTPFALAIFYGLCLVFLGLSGWSNQIGILFWPGLVLSGVHLWRQVSQLDIDDPEICARLFKSNFDFGLINFCAILLGVF